MWLCLVDFPDCNTIWQEQHMLKFKEVAIGVAISTEAGLYTPTLRDIDKKPVSSNFLRNESTH